MITNKLNLKHLKLFCLDEKIPDLGSNLHKFAEQIISVIFFLWNSYYSYRSICIILMKFTIGDTDGSDMDRVNPWDRSMALLFETLSFLVMDKCLRILLATISTFLKLI
eukprot:TRINITY_DN2307_c0_g1_i4.p1 TRINITY_DN2307_c0_g1~~TRINITY_DN2307_c0_g1_i4.p1  ORF type:complete len:109 (-),score=7.09 TRINITY_DN2307_c0_g1_i4:128-454(-)